MLIASRQPSALPVIDEIVKEAVKLAHGDLLVRAAVANVQIAPLTTMTRIENTAAISAVDLQSLASGSPEVESVFLAADLSGKSMADKASVADMLLKSALDAPFNDNSLAGLVLIPETVVDVEAEEDMQALLSLMAVEESIPVLQAAQEFGDPPQPFVSTPEISQEVENAEITREPGDNAVKVPEATPKFCTSQHFNNEPAQVEFDPFSGYGYGIAKFAIYAF